MAKSGPGETKQRQHQRVAGTGRLCSLLPAQSRAGEAAELNQTALSLVLRGTAALSGQTSVLGKELMVFTRISFLDQAAFSVLPHEA